MPTPACREIDLAWLPLGLVDQLGHGIDLELVGIGDQHAQEAGGERHRREILSRVEWSARKGPGGLTAGVPQRPPPGQVGTEPLGKTPAIEFYQVMTA